MPEQISNNKRIAKNTGLLYFRMLLSMMVSLYTSRIILNALGVEDYGIYNAVCGVVGMLSFLNSSLNTATQRYMNVAVGKDDNIELQKVFSMSFWAFALMAVIVIFIAETFGLYFFNTQMVIPENRINTANWIYQFSIISFAINLLNIPCQATIIAHERMSIYAYLSIFDVVMKLLMALIITKVSTDALWLYAFSIMVIGIISYFLYWIICKRIFQECRISLVWDKKIFTGLYSFSGWMLSGTITHMLSTQGVNILINIYFGPIMNAARGIALQVQSAVGTFAGSFMTAVRPPIMKAYAQEDYKYMYDLTFTASRLLVFILLVFVLPIALNAYDVLYLWLGTVPEHSVLFCQLALFDLLLTQSYNPIAYVNQATGDIKSYQIMISCGFTLIFILTWVLYSLGLPAEICLVVSLIIDVIGLFARLWIMKISVSFPVIDYLRIVTVPVILVLCLSFIASKVILLLISASGILFTLFRIFLCFVITSVMIWMIGMTRTERSILIKYLVGILGKLKLIRNCER